MKFTARPRSNKNSDCRRLASSIAKAARAMGLEAGIESSRVSASHYVYVADGPEAEPVKIRVSDHDDRYGADWHAWAGEHPSDTIERMADHFGRSIPAGFRRDDFDKASARAKEAARVRSRAAFAAEKAMVAAVVEAMEGDRLISTIATGKKIDEMFPGIPKAKRQRMAGEASYQLKKARET